MSLTMKHQQPELERQIKDSYMRISAAKTDPRVELSDFDYGIREILKPLGGVPNNPNEYGEVLNRLTKDNISTDAEKRMEGLGISMYTLTMGVCAVATDLLKQSTVELNETMSQTADWLVKTNEHIANLEEKSRASHDARANPKTLPSIQLHP